VVAATGRYQAALEQCDCMSSQPIDEALVLGRPGECADARVPLVEQVARHFQASGEVVAAHQRTEWPMLASVGASIAELLDYLEHPGALGGARRRPASLLAVCGQSTSAACSPTPGR
jgi:hypothetical protein